FDSGSDARVLPPQARGWRTHDRSPRLRDERRRYDAVGRKPERPRQTLGAGPVLGSEHQLEARPAVVDVLLLERVELRGRLGPAALERGEAVLLFEELRDRALALRVDA